MTQSWCDWKWRGCEGHWRQGGPDYGDSILARVSLQMLQAPRAVARVDVERL